MKINAAMALLSRFATVLFGLVGLVFLVVGGWLLYSQTWSAATGTAGACTSRFEPAGSSRRLVYTCDVTWQADAATHTATVDVGNRPVAAGAAVDLRVDGDNAVVASPAWVGGVTAGLGAVLVVVAAGRAIRARRAGAPSVTG